MGTTGDFVKIFEQNGFKMENMGKMSFFSNIIVPYRDLTGGADMNLLANNDRGGTLPAEQFPSTGSGCVGKYVYDRGLTDKTELTIETRAGIKTLWLNVVGGTVETVRVCMGSPEFRPEKIPVAAAGETFLEQPIDVLGATWIVSSVNTGNPHCVTYVDDAMALDFPRIGPAFENHKLFPARANIEFVEVVDRRWWSTLGV